MRTAFLLSLMLASIAAADPTTEPTTQVSGTLGTPIELFNGKDLTGWTCITRAGPTGPAATQPSDFSDLWYVTNGILTDKGNPFGYIRTSVNYTNFTLLVEQRHLDKGNGGIFVAISGPDMIFPHCLEMQGLVGEEGDIRGITTFKIHSDPARTEARRFPKIGPNSEKPIGEWESILTIVDHGTIRLFVNGVFQNWAINDGDLTGEVGLQAEGGLMEFRKVELTPIMENQN
ncbi:MAG: DUF1080 domain-containing protein [Tepidisphaeraceae bacterium]